MWIEARISKYLNRTWVKCMTSSNYYLLLNLNSLNEMERCRGEIGIPTFINWVESSLKFVERIVISLPKSLCHWFRKCFAITSTNWNLWWWNFSSCPSAPWRCTPDADEILSFPGQSSNSVAKLPEETSPVNEKLPRIYLHFLTSRNVHWFNWLSCWWSCETVNVSQSTWQHLIAHNKFRSSKSIGIKVAKKKKQKCMSFALGMSRISFNCDYELCRK